MVDDEPFMLEGMRLMIDWAGHGFELVGEASSAQEALHLVDTLRPHLLITDVRMPGMQGTDLAAIVRNYHPETILLFFSGYRDFTFAQQAIRTQAFGYLLKPIDADEVHQTLVKVKAELDSRAEEPRERLPMLRDHVLRRVALGDDSAEMLLRLRVLLDLKRDEPCYCVILLCQHGVLNEGDKLLLTACGATSFQLSPNQCGLSFRQIERDLPGLERLRLALRPEAEFRVSVGKVHRGAEGFARSMREALDAQGVLFQPEGELRLYRALDDETVAWLTAVETSRLVDAMLADDAEMLEERLQALQKAVASAPPSAFALRYLAAALDETTTATNSPLRPLWETEMNSCRSWVTDFCKAVRLQQENRRHEAETVYSAPVQAVLEILRQRYAEPLSMNGVAEELYMNPAYLGQLFRRQTGATFHQRLLETRIERACVLLRQTASSVGEVALSVGFRDVDYFSQQFRVRMAVSPVAYRGAVAGKEVSFAPEHQ